ncbi:vegetative cell wall protein gp1-like [Zingiber officinale]|uniref:vegetative cell wall protein gp1-like n=1 Tax=Zingiber officinale TaxID=94328 RepID=UPI001C4D0EA5|nr:vegetative cell wall protein gp1-like [Zingiber officinale]
MRRGTRASVLRRGAGRPRKRTLESLVAESPEMPTGVEPVGQGQTQDTAGASGSQTPMAPLEVLTSTVPAVPTPTVVMVPPAVPRTHPVPPTSTYGVPGTIASGAYCSPDTHTHTSSNSCSISGATPTVPLVAPTNADPAVPPATPAPTYAVAPGVLPSVYLVVLPIAPAPFVPPVPAAAPTHLTDIVAARARIPALAESMKS